MNQRKKTTAVLFVLLLVFLLGACGREREQDFPPKASLEEHQIFLFNPFSYELGIFDLNTMEWHAIDAQGAFFSSL